MTAAAFLAPTRRLPPAPTFYVGSPSGAVGFAEYYPSVPYQSAIDFDYQQSPLNGVQILLDSPLALHTHGPVSGWMIVTLTPALEIYTKKSWQDLWRNFFITPADLVRAPTALVHYPGKLRTDRLAKIQAAFGFSIQTLADVLRLSRAQLYKWLDPEKDIQLQQESRDRLQQIENLAARWLELSNASLNIVAREPLESGDNIIGLMSRARLDLPSIEAALDHMAGRVSLIPPSLSQQMRVRGFTRRPSAGSLPSDE
jgi:hypothetical protein